MRGGFDGAGAPATDLGWMERQVHALYVHDPNGRLLASNQVGDDRPAPRLFLGRTRHGNLWRLRADLPDALVRELARLAAAERTDPDLERDPERLPALVERLEGEAPVERVWRGPAFRFPTELPSTEGAELLGPQDAERVAGSPGLPGWVAEHLPAAVVVRDGGAVSVAYCATRPGAPGAAVEAGVQTWPGWRSQGLASAAVAAWARALRASGRVPLYSTSWDNHASCGVARRLGLILYGSDLHLT